MELHNQYGCYISIHHPSENSVDGFKNFFEKNHFIIAHNMFDEEWNEKTQLEEIFKKLILIYNFDKNNENIIVVYKNRKRVYLPNEYYVNIPPRGIFVYDKSKLKVSY
jgi:hypothetical protein